MTISWRIYRSTLAIISVLVLCGILFAGLHPFTPHPRNDVSWLAGRHGLRFGDHGTILSSGDFKKSIANNSGTCSLELWLQPGLISDSNDILSFYSPSNPLQFRISQNGTSLALFRDFYDLHGRLRTARINVGNAFHPDASVFITITAGRGGSTTVYLDGKSIVTSSGFDLTNQDLVGELIVGNSPVEDYSWAGELFGLAFYNIELTPRQVLQHYHTWVIQEKPDILRDDTPLALYFLNEGSGATAHNQVSAGPDLDIPDHYLILHQIFLQVPWKEFHADWAYCKDVIINVAGLIPMGFFLYGYFSARGLRRPWQLTVLFGGILSFSIEILQAYIPTRNSGMTDIITNTVGTAIGAVLWRLLVTQRSLERVGIQINPEN